MEEKEKRLGRKRGEKAERKRTKRRERKPFLIRDPPLDSPIKLPSKLV